MTTATFFSTGRGRSRAAETAESDGRYPLTRATSALRAAVPGLTVAAARAALTESHDGEWHHVGKYARRCAYYSIEAAIERLARVDRLPAARAAVLAEIRAWRVRARHARAAAEWSVSPEGLAAAAVTAARAAAACAARAARHAVKVRGLAEHDRNAHARGACDLCP